MILCIENMVRKAFRNQNTTQPLMDLIGLQNFEIILIGNNTDSGEVSVVMATVLSSFQVQSDPCKKPNKRISNHHPYQLRGKPLKLQVAVLGGLERGIQNVSLHVRKRASKI